MKFAAMRVAVSACALTALAAIGAVADETTPAPDDATAGLSDMKVARDKQTGKLRAPTAEESAELAASARTIAPGIVVLSRPVTTVEYRADGSAVGKRSLDDMIDLKLTTTPDGKQVLSHSNAATEHANPPAGPAQELPQE